MLILCKHKQILVYHICKTINYVASYITLALRHIVLPIYRQRSERVSHKLRSVHHVLAPLHDPALDRLKFHHAHCSIYQPHLYGTGL